MNLLLQRIFAELPDVPPGWSIALVFLILSALGTVTARVVLRAAGADPELFIIATLLVGLCVQVVPVTERSARWAAIVDGDTDADCDDNDENAASAPVPPPQMPMNTPSDDDYDDGDAPASSPTLTPPHDPTDPPVRPRNLSPSPLQRPPS